MTYDVCVIGAGPAGYVAAIRSAQLGGKVLLVERDLLGGICLNWGCIPTKCLAATVELYSKIKQAGEFGIDVKEASVNFSGMMKRKELVVEKLRAGIEMLLKARKIEVIKGAASFLDKNTIQVDGNEYSSKNFIIAAGSSPAELPFLKFDGKNILTSKDILEMKQLPKSILIVGGGAIGCEYANILSELGCSVTIVEMLAGLLPGEDRELGKRLEANFKKRGISIFANTKIEKVDKKEDLFTAQTNTQQSISAEKILISVGRRPNTQGLGLEKIGLALDKGRIIVDEFLRTNVENVYAAGDVTGGYLLAHVASYEGIIASENISGKKEKADYALVPNCIYTNPEIASVGLSEAKAKEQSISINVGKFPFQALGKAHVLNETEGFVKLIADKKSDKILGAQIMGPHATSLIAELSVVIKAGFTSEALAKTIHAHPTLPEAVMEAAEAVKKQAIHIV